ncbi:MAG: tetratricopeptide repeat protein [Chloroflexi bacterium]|nr:tetratricopeptide repeat protein [Chloroflexota bacterium]
MSRLQLNLFGPMQAIVAGKTLHFATAKVQALLAYLALEPERPYRREQLAALLWPDQPDADARRNLRLTLHRLKQTFAEADPDLAGTLISAGRNTVRWHGDAVTVDVAQFMHLITQTETHDHPRLDACADCRQRLETAASLLRGELLAGLSLDDAMPFEEWLLVQREFIHHRALRLYATLADIAENQGDYAAALNYAQRQLTREPWYEAAHRQAMRALALGGNRDRALAQYESCRAVLDEELGVEPSAETAVLHQQIRANSLSARPAAVPIHHLPTDLTPFIGRDAELAQITAALQNGREAGINDSRLLTLIGPGGAGKTRLTIQAVRQIAARAAADLDAITFVPLAAAADRQTAVSTLAARLGVALSGADNPLQELVQHLRAQRHLLVLDNLEQLADAAALVEAILQGAPQVQILATSREPLHLHGEQRLPVGGLPYPGDPAAPDAHKTAAVALFVQSARQMSPGFRLDAEAATAVVGLCRLVDGLPLGLELAAGWVRLMDCAAILREAEQNLDFLATNLADLPARHRSLHAIFHQTWTMLAPHLRDLLARAALFPGDFSLAALQGIAPAATMLDVATLLDKSLLRRNAANHYELHPLLKQFVTAETDPPPAWRQQFSRFYLHSAAQRQADLHGRTPQQAMRQMRRDQTNMRQAWRWAADHALWEEMAAALPVLSRFHQMAGLFAEAVTALSAALDALPEMGETTVFRTQLHLKVAHFRGQQGQYAQAIAAAEAALALAEAQADSTLQAQAEASIGEWRRHQGRFEEAAKWLKTAVSHFQATPSPELATAHNEIGFTHMGRGQYPAARQAFEQALLLFEELGDQSGTAVTLGNLGYVSQVQSRYDDARDYLQRALAMAQAIDDRQSIVKHTLGLGWVALQRGDMDAAQRQQQAALELAADIGYLRGVLTAQRHMADACLYQNRLDDAETGYRRLLHRAQQAQLTDLAAHATGNLGIVYARRGSYDAAIAQYEAAIAHCRELDDPVNLRKHLGNLGSTFRRLGRLDEAEQCFQDALRTERIVGLRHGEANTLVNLGALSRQHGELDTAVAYFEQALALHTALNHPDGIAKSEGFLGMIYQQKGEFAAAAASYEAALARSEQIGDRLTAAVWRHNLSETALAAGDPAAAEAYVVAALATFRQLQSKSYIASTLVTRGRILHAQGQWAAARLALDEAITLATAVGEEKLLFKARVLQARCVAAQGDGETAVAQLNALLPDAATPAQEADALYALWETGGDAAHAAAVLALYRTLLAQTPDYVYRERVGVLTTVVRLD